MSEPMQHPHPHLLLPVPFVLLTAGQGAQLWRGDLWLAGWSFLETTGVASAQVSLFDGGDANGVPVSIIPLSSGQGTRDFFGGHFLVLRAGLFVTVSSGSVSGVLYLADK